MLILASRSPQRREILTTLGIGFRVVVSEFVETERGGGPEALAAANAVGKARDVASGLELHPDVAVLGVDTVVAVDERSLGSPTDAHEARSMLSALSGRDHRVISAICLIGARGEHQDLASTQVRFRDLSVAEVAAYVATDEWRDRAGGYAIQGAGMGLVAEIHGDYSNVVGLPIATLMHAVGALGLGGVISRS